MKKKIEVGKLYKIAPHWKGKAFASLHPGTYVLVVDRRNLRNRLRHEIPMVYKVLYNEQLYWVHEDELV